MIYSCRLVHYLEINVAEGQKQSAVLAASGIVLSRHKD
jgi:hypothetical protein